MKLSYLALLATLTLGLLPTSRAQNNVAVSAETTTPLFDVSGNACYYRMQALDELTSRGFKDKAVDLSYIRDYRADEKVLGLEISAWDEHAFEAFYAALQTCTEPESMRLAWDDKYIDTVNSKLPTYIAEKRENTRVAVQMLKIASSDGVSFSCIDAINYPLKSKGKIGGYKNEENYLPFDKIFGKDFVQYTDGDYAFVRQKLADCVSLIESTSAKTGNIIADTSKLKKLEGDMASWNKIQSEQIVTEDAAKAAREQEQRQKAEGERRKNDPSFFEKIADYLGKFGVVGVIVSGIALPKKDGRFKNGYKNNATTPGWVLPTMIGSIAMIFLGWVLGG